MNRKQLILLLFVLVVIGGAGLVLLHQRKESWAVHEAKMGDKVLPNFQPNAVAAIRVRGESSLNVLRKNGAWCVQERWDYPANFSQVSDLLIKLKDLAVVEAEAVGPSDLGRVNLDEPGKGASSGTLVEFMDAQGKLIESLLLGKKHIRQLGESHSALATSEPDGRYILLPSDSKYVLLISNTLAVLEPRPAAWLNKDFFKTEKVKSISLASFNPSNSWKVSRQTESATWALTDNKPGEALDTAKIAQAVNTMGFIRFVDVVSTNAGLKTGLDTPMTVTVETFDNFTYTIKVGAKSAEDASYMTVGVVAAIPAGRAAGKDEKPEDKQKLDKEFQDETGKLQDKLKTEKALEPWIYVVNTWILDPLIRDRAQILQGSREEKTADATPQAASPTPSAPKNSESTSETPGWTPRVIK